MEICQYYKFYYNNVILLNYVILKKCNKSFFHEMQHISVDAK